MNDSLHFESELKPAPPTNEDVVAVWAIDRSKPGLPLTLYPTGRTLIITADKRDKIARSLSGHCRCIDRGLQFTLARLYLDKFTLQCYKPAIPTQAPSLTRAPNHTQLTAPHPADAEPPGRLGSRHEHRSSSSRHRDGR